MKRLVHCVDGIGNMRSIRGFTLVELLIVIAALSILLSLLIPSLRRVVEIAPTFTCLNQQKSIGQATVVYCDDYRGFFPTKNNRSEPTGSVGGPGPQHRLGPYFGGQPTVSDVTVATLMRRNVPLEMASAQRLRAEIWFCPMDMISGLSDRREIGVSYQMNGFDDAVGPNRSLPDNQTIFFDQEDPLVSGPLATRRVQDVLMRTMLLGCSSDSGPSNAHFTMWGTNPRGLILRWKVANGLDSSPTYIPWREPYKSSYHRDMTCNFLFTDGSAQNLDPRETVDFNMNAGTRDGKNYSFWAINK